MKSPVAAGDLLDGKYRIEKVLGAGGMGVVVQALHEKLEQRVAIKFLLPTMKENADVVSRFAREARASARIKSNHVARVIDVSSMPDGCPYMVMEFLEGQDLRQVLRAHGPIPLEPLADYMLQALEGLSEAHRVGVIHRDLKPANLFLANERDGQTSVKVLDFGISKLANDLNDPSVTSSIAMLGSPIYMSPEQVRLSKAVDHRADLWSIGATMYELACGSRPFPREAIAQMVSAILFDVAPPPSSIRPDLPPAFDALIARCLEKDPQNRFASCGELAMAIAPFASLEAQDSVARICRTKVGLSTRTKRPVEVDALLARSDPGTHAPVNKQAPPLSSSGITSGGTSGKTIAFGFAGAAAALLIMGIAYRTLASKSVGPAVAEGDVASGSNGSSGGSSGSTAAPRPPPTGAAVETPGWTESSPNPNGADGGAHASTSASSIPPVSVRIPRVGAAASQPRAGAAPKPAAPTAVTPTPADPKTKAGTVSGFGPRD